MTMNDFYAFSKQVLFANTADELGGKQGILDTLWQWWDSDDDKTDFSLFWLVGEKLIDKDFIEILDLNNMIIEHKIQQRKAQGLC